MKWTSLNGKKGNKNMSDTLNRTGYPYISLPKIGTLRKGMLLRSDPLFWVTYQRETDGQCFIEEVTQQEILQLLEAGGIRLIHIEAAVDRRGRWKKREVRI